MAQSYRAYSIWHNDIIITWHSLLVLFVSAANEFAAQNSNTWLVLAVAVCFRNPPPSPAPPVYPFVWWFIHVCYIWWLFRICYMCSSISYLLTAAFCGCIGRSKTRYLLCHSSSSVADLFHQTPKGKNIWLYYHANPSESCPDRNIVFYCIFDQVNETLLSIRNFFQKH